MKKNKFKSVSKVTIGVYVLAVLMGGIALYNVYTCYDYIASIVLYNLFRGDGVSCSKS